MKKSRRVPDQAKANAEAVKIPPKRLVWWPWAAVGAALVVALEAYGPSLRGDFVLDDLYLPFGLPNADQLTLWDWISRTRPVLMFSYWLNYRMSGTETYSYHATNVLLHTLVAAVIALVTAKMLELSAVAGRARTILSIFAGGLFLLHPLQTESVAYVASRSEVLSVLFYFSAFALFAYRSEERAPWWRAVLCAVLLLIAVNTKEHTLTLPFLLLASTWFWARGSIRKNVAFFTLQAVAGVIGAYLVMRVLRAADTAGFNVKGVTPVEYFFTQCRVIWMYIRQFFLPAGQNVDPDIPVSANPLQHGALFGFLALLAFLVAAWLWRKRWPLAAFGVFMFLLLLAPTSSFVPIQDVYAERRMYLPFLGLTLVVLEFLLRLDTKPMLWTAAGILAVCAALTYQRSEVWSSPLALWKDTVAKSPHKVRPRFQLAYAYYTSGQCAEAVENYQIAGNLAPPDYLLLVDWSNALYCAGQNDAAIERLHQALAFPRPAEAYLLLGAIYAKQGHMPDALEALAQAEKINPSLGDIYVNRGNIFLLSGDHDAAVREYQRALSVDPSNPHALEALSRAGGR
jgi:tetratricopeptide (TPR) repeat protein